MGGQDRNVPGDKLVLADAYFKCKDRVNRLSYSEASVTFDGDLYTVEGMKNSKGGFEPFIFKIPKDRVLKDKPVKELDNWRLYFAMFDNEDKTSFLLWLTFEEWGAENIPKSVYE
jgi:hypothetical protein